MARRGARPGFRPRDHDHEVCIEDALAAAEEICAARGVRLTPLRRRVLELVWEGHEPVRAYDVLDALRRERAGAAPPTVYRALEFLLAAGLVHRLESLNAFVGCAHARAQHAGQFLICRGCGRVAELDDAEVGTLIARRASALGFRSERQTIEVTGLCPGCRAGAP